MEYSEMIETLCERCTKHEECRGEPCEEKKELSRIAILHTPVKVGISKECKIGVQFYCPECGSDQIRVRFADVKEIREPLTDKQKPVKNLSHCWRCGQVLEWEK